MVIQMQKEAREKYNIKIKQDIKLSIKKQIQEVKDQKEMKIDEKRSEVYNERA